MALKRINKVCHRMSSVFVVATVIGGQRARGVYVLFLGASATAGQCPETLLTLLSGLRPNSNISLVFSYVGVD